MLNSKVAAAQKKLALLEAAKYRHAWDYGTEEEEGRAFEVYLNSWARYEVYNIVASKQPRADLSGEDLDRLISVMKGSVAKMLRLPLRSRP